MGYAHLCVHLFTYLYMHTHRFLSIEDSEPFEPSEIPAKTQEGQAADVATFWVVWSLRKTSPHQWGPACTTQGSASVYFGRQWGIPKKYTLWKIGLSCINIRISMGVWASKKRLNWGWCPQYEGINITFVCLKLGSPAKHFGDLHRHFAWQVQHFRRVVL